MGPACSGKTHFIKKNYPNAKVIDLYDFQKESYRSIEGIWQSYEKCAEALKETIKNNVNNDTIILEHTLLKRIRREWYISQIREVTNEDIDIVCIKPSETTLYKRIKEREIEIDIEDTKMILSILETPVIDEGYSNITILTD
jgi:predicted kinase